MNRVLVTTALGQVGRQVVASCRDLGIPVRVSHLELAPLEAAHPELENVRLDFLDRSTWPSALAGCDGVFLLRPPPIGDMATTLAPFIDAACEAGVEHVVFLSVSRADEMKWVPHHEVEQHLARSGDRWTVLRPGFFAQNLETAYRRDILEDGRLYVPAGDGRVAFVDVRDVGEVAARVLADPGVYRGKAITLTGPEAVTFGDAARLLSKALGREVRYEPASIPGYVVHLRRRGMPWAQVAVQTVLHVGLRRGDAARVDPEASRILGRRPRDMGAYVWTAASALRT